MSQNFHEQWTTEGYVVVRGVFDPRRSERLLEICNETLRRWRACDAQTGLPGGNSESTEMRHLNHPAYFSGRSHADYAALMEAVADPGVLNVIRTLFGGEAPLFRCTSYFFNPLHNSRDGNWHRDTQFTCRDEAEEKRCFTDPQVQDGGVQMQVALVRSEDVEFVPGSHLRWDTPEEYAIRRADGGKHCRSAGMPGALRIALNPGDAAIFNARGLHRGRYHTDKTRRTLMLTYTRTSHHTCDYFSKQPWFLETDCLGGLKPATREFFERFIAVYRDFWQTEALQAAR